MTHMIDLSHAPARMLELPRDVRGYPVPWFVHWNDDGTPDFRVIGHSKIQAAVRQHLCWVCGQQMGRFMAFVIGPMCAVNRISGEPPLHRDCAIFSATTCPFLTKPQMKRNERELPEESKGFQFSPYMLKRNPGVTMVWVTKEFRIVNANPGVLFQIGDQTEILWYCEGRKATRTEILHSIETGLPALSEMAAQDGQEALSLLEEQLKRALALIPSAGL
jgi:hypothetical protein